MTRIIAVAIMVFLGITQASAQDAAYKYTAPAGWTKQTEDNLVQFVPSSDKTGSTVLILSGVLPAAPNADQQFTGMRSVLETSLGMRRVKDGEIAREQSDGGESIVSSGAYEMNSHQVVAVFFGRKEKGAFGMGVLLTGNMEQAVSLGDQANVMVNTLRLTDQAQKLAAVNLTKLLQEAAAQSNAQPQPGVAAQPAPSQPAKAPNSGLAEAAKKVMNAPYYSGIGPGGMSIRNW